MARLTQNYAVIDRCQTALLHMSDVMCLRPFAESVLATSYIAERNNSRPAAAAPMFLANQSELLRDL